MNASSWQRDHAETATLGQTNRETKIFTSVLNMFVVSAYKNICFSKSKAHFADVASCQLS